MSQARKDYYKILGITEEEKNLPWDDFCKIVKNKYRKLAVQYHPDKQANKSEAEKKDAEEKFKEIAEAYEILGDKDKKAEYDNPLSGGGFNGNPFEGFGGFNPFGGGFDPFDIFGTNSKRKREPQRQKGNSMRIEVKLTLEDIFNGVTKTIKYKRQEPCHECHGSGIGANGRVETCPVCGGTGTEFSQRQGMQVISTCRRCHGTGKVIKNPCRHCDGSGLEVKDHETTINIPKGIMEGTEFVVQGEGCLTANSDGIPGDLIVRIGELEHDTFVRRGNDILFELKVPVIDAILGTKVNVTTIDGKVLSTAIQPGTEDGTNIKFANKGLPIYDKEGRFGHMIGIVKLIMPKKLNAEEKEILEQLKTKEHFNG